MDQITPSPTLVLESNTRLSKSMLWELQKTAYFRFGPKAWADKGVPFYITSNPFIARQYAFVVLGYLRDLLRQRQFDAAHPLYIFDLGAGTGRFGYLFLKNLNEILGILHRYDIHIRYVMTDIAPENIAFWRSHPYLQNLIKEGMLDFAFYYHAEEDKPLKLIVKNEILTPESTHNPLIVIGNYFFDTIPQDLFMAKEGKLYEGRVTLSFLDNAATKQIPKDDPDIINHLQTLFEYAPIDDPDNYYPERPDLTALLKEYAEKFEGIPFLFPEGAFKTIRYFTKLSRGRMLMLAGDQGKNSEKHLRHYNDPYIAKHGSFSIPVNYHVIATHIRREGGTCLLTTQKDITFIVSACILSGESNDFPETSLAFKMQVDQFDPNDYYLLLDYTEKEWSNPSIDFIILLVKLGNWDVQTLLVLFDAIRKKLFMATTNEMDKLEEAIHNSWNNYYPVASKEEASFVMNLGVLFGDMKRWKQAVVYLEKALAMNPQDPLIRHNLAVCYEHLDEHDKAEELKNQNQSELGPS